MPTATSDHTVPELSARGSHLHPLCIDGRLLPGGMGDGETEELTSESSDESIILVATKKNASFILQFGSEL